MSIHERVRRPPLLVVVASAGALVAVVAAVFIFDLRQQADRMRADARLVARIEVGVQRAQALGWQGLAEGEDNFTIRHDVARVARQLRMQSAELRAVCGASGDRTDLLIGILVQGLRRETAELRRGRAGDARAALETTLRSTSHLLDSELADLRTTARASADSGEARAVTGTFVILLVAVLVCLALAVSATLITRRSAAAERDALRRSEERFRGLVENANEIILVVDREGVIQSIATDAAQAIIGRTADELTGRHVADLVRPDQREHVRAALGRVADNHGRRQPIELEIEHADGRTVHVEAIGNNLLDVPTVGGIVITLRDITERKAMEEELRHQAFHDALTELPNRALFEDRLDQAVLRARRQRSGVAVLYLDLDDFKAVNDSLGHTAGDTLLVEVAKRIDGAVRGSDTTARLGGDEFAVLIEDADPRGTAFEIADRVHAALAPAIPLGERPVHVRASIGVAHGGADLDDAAGLLRDADIAMYAAKTGGKAGVELFDPAMLHEARARLDLREDLRLALETQSLDVHYQPIVELGGGTVHAVEALVRWTHPEHGSISPVRFIPIAEEACLIVELGRWVLRRACADAVRLHAALPGCRVGVNVSVLQLRDPAFLDDVRAALADTGLAAERLVLELTESVFAEDGETEEVVAGLRDIGVALSVDDFGTGYSSLGHLRHLDVDSVKIDRSFVAGIGEFSRDAALVRSIVELGHAMGLTIVAEGVESAEQATFLQDASCEHAQGYLYGRPAPLEALLDGVAAV